MKVTPESIEALRPYCKDIRVLRLNKVMCAINIVRNWFSSKSLQMGYWNTSHSKRVYKAYEREVQPDVVYNQMVRTMPLVARSKYPKVMDFQDALSMNTERRMERSRGLWHYVLHYEFKMLRSSEYNAFSFFDALTIISEADSEAIPHKKNGEIKIVPNGVDFDFFRPDAVTVPKEHDIVFCGNMSYAPNVSAARYLVEKVMPLVWAKRPSTTLLLAGASPKHSIWRLGLEDRVTVSGWVDDIRTAYASSRLFVAPMLIGSGLQNKLLEAMAMQMPCVTTSLANIPLGATNGDQLLVGDDAETLAEHIVSLLDNTELSTRIADSGHRFVHENYSWSAAVKPLEELLNAVVSK